MPVVIDSSALVDLVAQTERAPAVAQAVGSTDMVAPDVVNPEVLSALVRLERTGTLTARRAVQAVDDLMDARCAGSRQSRCWWRRGRSGPTSPPPTPAMSFWPGSSGAPWSPPTGSCPGLPGWACR